VATHRTPTSGTVTIEWVDAGDRDDASAPPSFGFSEVRTEPKLEGERLLELLRFVPDCLESDLREDGR
jgi:hypothetical protein